MPSEDAILGKLGMNEKEIVIYKALLQIGTAPASMIARRTKMNRSTAQYTCQQLAEKGLLHMVQKNNTFIYTAEPPETLLSILERQRRKLDRQEHDLQQVVGSLKSLMQTKGTMPRVQFYEGVHELEKLVDRLPEERQEIFTFSAGDYLLQKIPEVVHRFRGKSKHNFLSKKIIRSPKYKDLHKEDPYSSTVETRYFKSLEELTVDIQIVDDLVSIISAEQDSPVAILIQHKNIAENLKNIFLQVWEELEESK